MSPRHCCSGGRDAAHPAHPCSALRLRRSAGRTRCGSPRTWPRLMSCPAAASIRVSASALRCLRPGQGRPVPRDRGRRGLRLRAGGTAAGPRADKPVTASNAREGFEAFSDRVQTHSPALTRRMWYGGGSLRSARWAGEHWMNLLTSSVVKTEGPGPEVADFAAIQLAHIRAFRAAHPDGGRPVFPRCWSLFLRTRRRPSSGPGMSSTPPSSCPARRRRRGRHARCSRLTWSAPRR